MALVAHRGVPREASVGETKKGMEFLFRYMEKRNEWIGFNALIAH